MLAACPNLCRRASRSSFARPASTAPTGWKSRFRSSARISRRSPTWTFCPRRCRGLLDGKLREKAVGVVGDQPFGDLATAQRAPILQVSAADRAQRHRGHRSRVDRRSDRPRRLQRLSQSPVRDDARRSHRRNDGCRASRPRRRRFSRGHQMGKRPQGAGHAEIHHLQQSRRRAERLQGPPDSRRRSAPHS